MPAASFEPNDPPTNVVTVLSGGKGGSGHHRDSKGSSGHGNNVLYAAMPAILNCLRAVLASASSADNTAVISAVSAVVTELMKHASVFVRKQAHVWFALVLDVVARAGNAATFVDNEAFKHCAFSVLDAISPKQRKYLHAQLGDAGRETLAHLQRAYVMDYKFMGKT